MKTWDSIVAEFIARYEDNPEYRLALLQRLRKQDYFQAAELQHKGNASERVIDSLLSRAMQNMLHE